MGLYLVTRTDKCGKNEFDSYIVAAKHRQEALSSSYSYYQSWKPEYTKVEFIGSACQGVEGVVIASFNTSRES